MSNGRAAEKKRERDSPVVDVVVAERGASLASQAAPLLSFFPIQYSLAPPCFPGLDTSFFRRGAGTRNVLRSEEHERPDGRKTGELSAGGS